MVHWRKSLISQAADISGTGSDVLLRPVFRWGAAHILDEDPAEVRRRLEAGSFGNALDC